jgi:hypothetical protein
MNSKEIIKCLKLLFYVLTYSFKKKNKEPELSTRTRLKYPFYVPLSGPLKIAHYVSKYNFNGGTGNSKS